MTKRINQALGVLLMTVGFATSGAGTYLFIEKPDPIASDTKAAMNANIASCKTKAKELAFSVKGTTLLELSELGINDPMQSLTRASDLVSHCSEYEMKSFCLGTECGFTGMKILLQYDESLTGTP